MAYGLPEGFELDVTEDTASVPEGFEIDRPSWALPEGFELDEPEEKGATFTGAAKALGRGVAEGATTELPKLGGEALEFVGGQLNRPVKALLGETAGEYSPFSLMEKTGKAVKEWSQEKAKDWFGEAPEDQPWLEKIIYEGSKMLAPSVIPGGVATTGARILKGLGGAVKSLRAAEMGLASAKATGDLAKIAEAKTAVEGLKAGVTAIGKSASNWGAGSAGVLFGLSQAQSTIDSANQRADELERQGLTDQAEEARAAGRGVAPYLTGAIEAVGEFFGTKYLGKLFKLDEAEVVRRGAKELAKDFFKTLGVEVGTEMGQAAGETGIEKSFGVRPDADVLEETLGVIGPTAFMTLLTGGLASGANLARKKPYQPKVQDPKTIVENIRRDLARGQDDEGAPFTLEHLMEYRKDPVVAQMGLSDEINKIIIEHQGAKLDQPGSIQQDAERMAEEARIEDAKNAFMSFNRSGGETLEYDVGEWPDYDKLPYESMSIVLDRRRAAAQRQAEIEAGQAATRPPGETPIRYKEPGDIETRIRAELYTLKGEGKPVNIHAAAERVADGIMLQEQQDQRISETGRISRNLSSKWGMDKSRKERVTETEDREFEAWARKAADRRVSDEELLVIKKIMERAEEDKSFEQWQVQSEQKPAGVAGEPAALQPQTPYPGIPGLVYDGSMKDAEGNDVHNLTFTEGPLKEYSINTLDIEPDTVRAAVERKRSEVSLSVSSEPFLEGEGYTAKRVEGKTGDMFGEEVKKGEDYSLSLGTPTLTPREAQDLRKITRPTITRILRIIPPEYRNKVNVLFKPMIDLEPLTEKAKRSIEEQGGLKPGRMALGMTEWGDVADTITIAYHFDDGTIARTAYHEPFHVVFRRLMPGKDRKALLHEYKTEEGAAKAFGQWAVDREGQAPKPYVQRIFERIRQTLKSIRSAWQGQGFRTPEQIFERVWGQKYRERQGAKEDTGTRFLYAGEKAAQKPSPLEDAKARLAAGESPETVRKETGWFKGKYDKKWRFEIDDSKGKLSGDIPWYETEDGGLGAVGKLGDFFVHKDLYSAYPALKTAWVALTVNPKSKSSANASFRRLDFDLPSIGAKTGDVWITSFGKSKEDIKPELLHEIQHAIQENENFAMGAEAALEGYSKSAGEIESRDVSARAGLTAEERAKTEPYSSENIPEEEAIVRYGESATMLSMTDKGKGRIPAGTSPKAEGGVDVKDIVQAYKRAERDRNVSVPEGWYLHGSGDTFGSIQEKVGSQVVEFKRDWDYADWERSPEGGDGYYAVKPKEDAKVFDLTDWPSDDLDHILDAVDVQFEKGDSHLTLLRDAYLDPARHNESVKEITREDVDEIKNAMEESLMPENIGEHSGAYENPDVMQWLVESIDVDFIKTPDGAVMLQNPDRFNIIRLNEYLPNPTRPPEGGGQTRLDIGRRKPDTGNGGKLHEWMYPVSEEEDAHRKVVDVYSDALEQEIPTESVRAVSRNDAESREAEVVARRSNLSIIFFEVSNDVPTVDGLFNRYFPNTIFINAKASDPLRNVVGHEILHSLRANEPDLYAYIDKMLREDTVNFQGYIDNINRQLDEIGLAPLSDNIAHEEFYADFMGQQFMNPEFWRKVTEGKPSLGRRILMKVHEILRSIRNALRGYGKGQRFTDIEKAQNVMAQVLAEYEGRRTEGKREKTFTEGETRLSVYDPNNASQQYQDSLFNAPQPGKKSLEDRYYKATKKAEKDPSDLQAIKESFKVSSVKTFTERYLKPSGIDYEKFIRETGLIMTSRDPDDLNKYFRRIQTTTDIAERFESARSLLDVQINRQGRTNTMALELRKMTEGYFTLPTKQMEKVDLALAHGDRIGKYLKVDTLRNKFQLSPEEITGYFSMRKTMDYVLEFIMEQKMGDAFGHGRFEASEKDPQPLSAADIIKAIKNRNNTLSRKHEGKTQAQVKESANDTLKGKLIEMGLKVQELDFIMQEGGLADWVFARRAYMPHGWKTEWRAKVVLKDGREFMIEVPTLAGKIKLTREGRRKAAEKAALREVAAKLGGENVSSVRLVHHTELPVDLYEGTALATAQGVIESATSNIMGEFESGLTDAEKSKLKEIGENITKSLQELYLAKGWGRHLLARKGIQGYRIDFRNVVPEYLYGFSAYHNKMIAAREFAKYFKEINASNTPHLWAWAKEYVSDMLGDTQEAGAFKKVVGFYFLAGDISAAALNMTQNWTHAVGILRGIQVKGGPTAEREIATAMKDVAGAWIEARGMKLPEKSKHLTPQEMEAIKEAFERGLLDPQFFGEVTGLHTNQWYASGADKAQEWLYKGFIGAEAMNRMSTFIAAFRRAQRAGEAKAVDIASKAVIDSHFLYGKGNRPELIRKMGALGNIAYTFGTYPLNNIFFLKQRALNILKAATPQERRTAMKVLGSNLAYIFAFGGLNALPFMFLGKFVYGIFTDPEDDWEVLAHKYAPQWAARGVVRGIPSVFGNDMSWKVEGTDIGITPIGIKTAQTIARKVYYQGYKPIERGEAWHTLFMVMPDMLSNPYKAFFAEGAGTGIEGKPLIEYTPGEKALKATGFSPTRESETRKVQELAREKRDARIERLGSFAERYIVALKEKDLAKRSDEIKAINQEVTEYNQDEIAKGREGLPIGSKEIEGLIKRRKEAREKGYEERMPKYMRPYQSEMGKTFNLTPAPKRVRLIDR